MVEDILPKGYSYKIVKSSVVSKEDFECEFRCNIDSELEFCKWLKEFQSSTNTYWILRNSVSTEISLFRLNRDYLCQHSSHRKKKEDGKDKKCIASLSVRMKRNSKFIRYRDPFVREGFFTRIKINFKHTHKINDTEISNWLPRTDKTKQIFIDYFDAGMNPATAKKYHEAMILAESPELIHNSSINPPSSWIYSRHQKWLEHQQWLEENVGGLGALEPIVPIYIENVGILKQEEPIKDLELEEMQYSNEAESMNEELQESNKAESKNEELQDSNEAELKNEELQDVGMLEPYTDEEDESIESMQQLDAESFNSENIPSNAPDKFEIVPKFCYQMDRIARFIEKSDDDRLLCIVDKFADKASKVSSVSDLYEFFDTVLVNHSLKKKLKVQSASISRRKPLFSRSSLTFRILRQNAVKRKSINKDILEQL